MPTEEDRLRALVAQQEPPELRTYLASLSQNQSRLVGSTVRALGAASFAPVGDALLLAPIGAPLPGPIDYIGSYITYDEYLDSGGASENDIIHALANSHERPRLVLLLALLNRMVTDRNKYSRLVQDYRSVLSVEARTRLDTVMSSDRSGLGRLLVARQPLLAALRYLLTQPQGSGSSLMLPELFSAVALSQAVAASLAAQSPSGGETLAGQPAHMVLEFVRLGLMYQSDDRFSSIDRLMRLWKMFGEQIENYPLRGTPAELVLESTGLEIEELLGLGFGLFAQSTLWEPGKPAYIDPDMGSDMPTEKISAFLSLVSASAGEFAQRFQGSTSAFDFLVFQETPVLRSSNGLLVLDEGYLWDRVTSGLYWLVHDHEKNVYGEAARHRWTQAYGEMVELMAEEQIRTMAPVILGESGGASLYTEEDFATAYPGKRCDAAIYFGPTIALFEIVSGQLSVPTRIEGSIEKFKQDTERLIIKKCRQLHEAASAILNDETTLTGFPQTPGLRVVPVVVVGGGYPINPLTLGYIRSALDDENLLNDPRSETVSVIDLSELEILEGLSERGTDPSESLRDWKHSTLAGVSFRNFAIRQYGGANAMFRPSRMKAHIDRTFKDIVARLRLRDTSEAEENQC